MKRIPTATCLAPLLLLLLAGVCHASTIFSVTLDTSPLIGHPAGPFAIDFQLLDGSGAGDGNNTATLSDFDFGAGGAVGSSTLTGGASGSLSTDVTITDTSFFNEFIQQFTPGGLLSFTLTLTTNVDSGLTPDQFSFSILDSSFSNLPTLDPGGALLFIDISSALAVSTFGTDATLSPIAGGLPISMNAPVVTPVAAVPEPSTFGLLASALTLLAAMIIGGPFRSARRPGTVTR